MKKKFNSKSIRINKFIALSGYCSRKQADDLIIKGKVKINGKRCSQLGLIVDLNDFVTVDGKSIIPERKQYILLNKPKGFSIKNNIKGKTVNDLLKTIEEKLFPVGELDCDTSGLLLLTNDNKLLEIILLTS